MESLSLLGGESTRTAERSTTSWLRLALALQLSQLSYMITWSGGAELYKHNTSSYIIAVSIHALINNVWEGSDSCSLSDSAHMNIRDGHTPTQTYWNTQRDHSSLPPYVNVLVLRGLLSPF